MWEKINAGSEIFRCNQEKVLISVKKSAVRKELFSDLDN
jgi:hypothetical protein